MYLKMYILFIFDGISISLMLHLEANIYAIKTKVHFVTTSVTFCLALMTDTFVLHNGN